LKPTTKKLEDATGAINDFIADGLFIRPRTTQKSSLTLDLILDMQQKRS
jgi:hypothetical protein